MVNTHFLRHIRSNVFKYLSSSIPGMIDRQTETQTDAAKICTRSRLEASPYGSLRFAQRAWARNNIKSRKLCFFTGITTKSSIYITTVHVVQRITRLRFQIRILNLQRRRALLNLFTNQRLGLIFPRFSTNQRPIGLVA